MEWLNAAWLRLKALARRRQLDRDLRDELSFHLAMREASYRDEGLEPDEARTKARRRFGNPAALREVCRDMWTFASFESFVRDLRFGLRTLAKSPGYTVVAVLSLALGIGANTAIFSILDVVMLKSLPVREPEKLVLFGNGRDMGLTNGFPSRSWDLYSYPFYRQVRQLGDVFSDVAAVQSIPWQVYGTVDAAGSSEEAERIDVQLVSGTYFSTLGVTPGIGRVLADTDDQTPGGHPVAVISHAWWTRRFGGDPAALGKTVVIDRQPYTIVGVAPREFFGTTVGQAPDMWVPVAMEAQMPPMHWSGRDDQAFQSLYLIARLKDGVTGQQAAGAANAQFKSFLEAWAGAQPAPERAQDIQRATIELTPAGRGFSELRQQFSLSLRILMGVVAVVLLIACANIANLLLARAAARQREFAVRMALGAGRARLIRQLLTESVLLAAFGGAAGVLLAWWGSSALVLMASSGSEALPLDVTPNARVLGFTLATSLLSAAIFGMAPALRAIHAEPNSDLKGGKGPARAGLQSPLGKTLVVAQVALSLVLLVSAGLFVRTLVNLQNVPTGFDVRNVLQFTVDTSTTGYEGPQRTNLLREVEERVKAAPGVEAASFAFITFNQGAWTGPGYTRGHDQSESQGRTVMNNIVGADYFAAMGIPLVLGRGFGPQDTETSQRVAVISETMAKRFFPDESPIGRRFGIQGPSSSDQIEVVGVVKDAKSMTLTEEARPQAYYPHAQGSGFLRNLVVRYSGAPEAVVPQVRRAVREVEPNLPVDEVITMSDVVGRSLVQQKLVARLAGFFGLLALLLAAVGLYGVLSYGVARRTTEIGVRMALGARQANVLRLVLGEALALVLVGVALGLVAAYFVTRLGETLLYGLTPTDPLTLASAAVLLIGVAAVAGYLPARKAARIDPMVALRYE